jgi:uncharacterized protein YqeY
MSGIAMATGLKEQLREDLNAARRERDKLRLLVLGTTLSELKNREIELGRDVTDEDVLDVLTKGIKKRREAAEQIRAGGRTEMAEREEQEALMLQAYLPPSLSEEEVRSIVSEIVAGGATAVGAVMSQLVPRIKGRYDARDANRIVREVLG